MSGSSPEHGGRRPRDARHDEGSRGIRMPQREEEAARLARATPVMPDGELAVPA